MSCQRSGGAYDETFVKWFTPALVHLYKVMMALAIGGHETPIAIPTQACSPKNVNLQQAAASHLGSLFADKAGVGSARYQTL